MGDLTPGRKQILLYLMNQKKSYVSPADIFNEERPIGMHHPNSVLKAVKEMKDQKLLELDDVGLGKRTSYKCWIPTAQNPPKDGKRTAQETFLALVKEFSKSDFLPFYSQRLFLSSKYAQEMVNSKLVDYVQRRLKTDWVEARRADVLQILKMSPSALRAALFSEREVQDESQLTDAARARLRKITERIMLREKELDARLTDAERAQAQENINNRALVLLMSNFVSDFFLNKIVKSENVQTCGATIRIFLDSRSRYDARDRGNVLKLSVKSTEYLYPIFPTNVPKEIVQLAAVEKPKHKKGKIKRKGAIHVKY